MLVEEVDDVGLKPLQRGVCNLLDMLGPAVHADLLARLGIDLEAELGGDYHLVADRRQSLPDNLLIGDRTRTSRGRRLQPFGKDAVQHGARGARLTAITPLRPLPLASVLAERLVAHWKEWDSSS